MKKDKKNIQTNKNEETKYICCTDIDGTLYLDDSNLNHTFKKIRNGGGKIVVISGRTIGDIKEEFSKRNLHLPDFIAGDNGACLYNTSTKEFILRKTLKEEKVKEIIKYYKQISGNADLIRYTDGYHIHASNAKSVKGYYEKKKTVEYDSNIEKKILKANNITKITLAGSEEEMKQVASFVQELGYWTDMGATKFPEREKSHYQRLDIAPAYINKGDATKEINERLNPEWGYACYGNDWNDLTMFKQTIRDGMKVFIMESAPQELIEEVKKYAVEMKKGGVYVIPENLNKANQKIERMATFMQKKKDKQKFDQFVDKKVKKRLPNLERVKVKPIKMPDDNNTGKMKKRSLDER